MHRVPTVLFLVSALGFALSIVYRRGSHPWGVAVGIVAGLLLGVGVIFLQGRFFALPKPIEVVPKVVFDRSASDLVLPSTLDTKVENAFQAMDTFMVAAQRLDTFPRVSENLLHTLESDKAAVLVMVHPNRELEKAEIRA